MLNFSKKMTFISLTRKTYLSKKEKLSCKLSLTNKYLFDSKVANDDGKRFFRLRF